MSFEIEGLLHKKFDTESKTESFQTREFVIKTEETYPQFVKFQLTQDKCALMDGFTENEKIKVYFDLRGREWQEKFFTNLQAWKIEQVGISVPPPHAEPPFSTDPIPPVTESPGSDFGDDLPF